MCSLGRGWRPLMRGFRQLLLRFLGVWLVGVIFIECITVWVGAERRHGEHRERFI